VGKIEAKRGQVSEEENSRRRRSQATCQAENPFLIKFSVHFAVFRFVVSRRHDFPSPIHVAHM